jgi:hypothetical protein
LIDKDILKSRYKIKKHKMKSLCMILVCVLLICTANASVYEANSSEDVKFFLEHNPDDISALMFYDEVQENNDPKKVESAKKVIGIFLNIGEADRSKEEWVNTLNDKAHLMRIDVLNPSNYKIMEEYRVAKTPFFVLFKNGIIEFEERVTADTYDHIKDILYKPKIESSTSGRSPTRSSIPSGVQASPVSIGSKQGSTQTPSSTDSGRYTPNSSSAPTASTSPSSPTSGSQKAAAPGPDKLDEAEKDLRKAQEDSAKAGQQMKDAQDDLKVARQEIATYEAVENAKKKAEEAQKASEEARKKYEEAKADMDKKINELNKDTQKKQPIIEEVRPWNSQPMSSYTYGGVKGALDTQIYGSFDRAPAGYSAPQYSSNRIYGANTASQPRTPTQIPSATATSTIKPTSTSSVGGSPHFDYFTGQNGQTSTNSQNYRVGARN